MTRHPPRLVPALTALVAFWLATSLACTANCSTGASPHLAFGASSPDPMEEATWWAERYGAADRDKEAVKRAQAIFERLRLVFDKAGRQLVVIDGGPREARRLGPQAVALRDGSVVVSYSALDLCFRARDRALGDARLAFVLAHELAHLDNKDHVSLSAAEAVHDFGGEGPSRSRSSGEASEERKKLELKADRQGALGMTRAEFAANRLFREDQNFFEEWVGGTPGRTAYASPDHPTPQERATWLRQQLAETAAQIVHFDRGLEAYGKRDYETAVDEFETFAQHFPSREVLSNLGLAHYRLAVRALARCDGQLVIRWRMPVAIDPETLADLVRLRGGESECYQRRDYREHIQRAIERLEEAVDQDPDYVRSRLNLAAALLLDNQKPGALLAADEAVRIDPESPHALGAAATAALAYAETRSPEAVAAEMSRLADLHRRFPDDPNIAYNLGQALTHGGRFEEAKPVWRAFVRLAEGKPAEAEWAKIARVYLE